MFFMVCFSVSFSEDIADAGEQGEKLLKILIIIM